MQRFIYKISLWPYNILSCASHSVYLPADLKVMLYIYLLHVHVSQTMCYFAHPNDHRLWTYIVYILRTTIFFITQPLSLAQAVEHFFSTQNVADSIDHCQLKLPVESASSGWKGGCYYLITCREKDTADNGPQEHGYDNWQPFLANQLTICRNGENCKSEHNKLNKPVYMEYPRVSSPARCGRLTVPMSTGSDRAVLSTVTWHTGGC